MMPPRIDLLVRRGAWGLKGSVELSGAFDQNR